MRKKILIVFLVLIFLYCIGGVIYSVLINNNKNDNFINSEITIKNFEYKINENKVSDLYKKEFNILKSNLENDNIDYQDYITSIAKLYIIDLYSLKDKTNKYDVTSTQYVNKLNQENFKLKVSETLYKYIEDNSLENRNQELPLVTNVNISSIENSTYLVGNDEYESYILNINWGYDKDLGYVTNAIITLIKNENIISVVEEKRIDIK